MGLFLISFRILISVSRIRIFSLWLGIEINIIGFILTIYSEDGSNSASVVEYFLVQSFSTLILIIGINLISRGGESKIGILLASIALLVKSRLPPAHWWFVKIFYFLSKENILLLRTIQKIIPFFVFDKIAAWEILFLVIAFSVIVAILVLALHRMLGVLRHSSVMASVWSFIVCPHWELVLFFLLRYGLAILIILSQVNLKFISVRNINFSYTGKIFVVVGILSLSGFPPMLGFLAKLGLIAQIVVNAKIFHATVLLVLTPFFLMGYLRIFVNLFMGPLPSNIRKIETTHLRFQFLRFRMLVVVFGFVWFI